MMAQRRGKRRGTAGSGRTRPFGLALALFALLCQSLVLLLPEPAQALPADAALFAGGYVLCQDDDGAAAPGSEGDKAPCPHCIDCPVCQAFHVGSGFVPPAQPALPVPAVRAVAFEPSFVPAHPLRLVAHAHQPRAPPSIPSL